MPRRAESPARSPGRGPSDGSTAVPGGVVQGYFVFDFGRLKLHDSSSQSESKSLNFRQLSSIIERCSGHCLVGAWPPHYVDIVQEKDGGDDPGRRRAQEGVAILDSMFPGVDMRYGVVVCVGRRERHVTSEARLGAWGMLN